MTAKKQSAQKDARNKLGEGFTSFLTSVRESLADIATLEVNSILVNNISADHPTEDEEFLRQTYNDLAEWFEGNKEIDGKLQEPLETGPVQELREKWTIYKPLARHEEGEKTIKKLGEQVEQCIKSKPQKTYSEMTDEERRQRAEYRRHLFYLQAYLKLHTSDNWREDSKRDDNKASKILKIEGRERNQLRKLWELVNTDFVYAQTVVGLDGDVVSRINQQLLDNTKHIYKDSAEQLMRFHSQNVAAGANYRNKMIDTLVQVVKAVLGRL